MPIFLVLLLALVGSLGFSFSEDPMPRQVKRLTEEQLAQLLSKRSPAEISEVSVYAESKNGKLVCFRYFANLVADGRHWLMERVHIVSG